jgi:adenylate cyclase class 2
MQGAEIELKFPVSDPQAFSRKVEALGFHLETARTFEHNTLYDTPDRSLRTLRQILRLRTYGSRCTLTHKRQPESPGADTRYKTRIETETAVDDCAALAEIFHQLGYEPAFHYEKYRTEWSSAETAGHLVLDETPIGTWAELEGEPVWIDAMMERLGVAMEDSTTASYGRLFTSWKEDTGSPAEHMTFEACQPVTA